MHSIRRRSILAIGSSFKFPTLPVWPLLSIASHGGASAAMSPGMIKATVAVGQILTQLQSAKGLGASLSAINGKQDIAIAQLSVIQDGVAFIVDRISKLPEDISKAISDDHAYRYRIEVTQKINQLRNIADDARSVGAPLEFIKEGRNTYREKWKTSYDDFKDKVEIFQLAQEGATADAAIICPAVVAIDIAAWSYRIISNNEIKRRLLEHKKWMGAMLDARNEYSVASAILRTKIAEKQIISEAGLNDSEAEDYRRSRGISPTRSDIAAALYSSPDGARFCVRYPVNTQYYSADPPNWRTAGVHTIDLGVTLKIALMKHDDLGVDLFIGPIDNSKRAGAMRYPNSKYNWSYNFDAFDMSTCTVEGLPDYKLPPEPSMRWTSTVEGQRGERGKFPLGVEYASKQGRRWRYLLSEPPNRSYELAINILESVNEQRIRRAFLTRCQDIAATAGQRVDVVQREIPSA